MKISLCHHSTISLRRQLLSWQFQVKKIQWVLITPSLESSAAVDKLVAPCGKRHFLELVNSHSQLSKLNPREVLNMV